MALQWDGAAIASRVQTAAERANIQAGEALLAKARAKTPIQDGLLRASGKASASGKSSAVSFNTVYAARQHEEVGWNHPGGGESKYLEKAKNEFAGEYAQIVANGMSGAI
ncbi:hypothetical protein ACFQ6H_27225 [Rhodococcus sp. NPDC056506]|uniref:hypothetical protein n=1 Tax=Rhodococcus sp. NPDC056506 TaxID=3345844 RepID=UPI003671ACAD